MKNLKLLGVMMFASLSVNAQAASILFDNYSYETASIAHSQAATIDATRGFQMVGNYKMIATASRSYKGDFQKKDLNGIANQDRSTLGLQVFAQSTGNLIQVIQHNLGKLGQNQGPTVIVYKAEGTATFTQFSYKAGVISDEVFFISECKILDDSALLCGKRFLVQDVSKVNPQQAAMHNTVVGFDLYVRN